MQNGPILRHANESPLYHTKVILHLEISTFSLTMFTCFACSLHFVQDNDITNKYGKLYGYHHYHQSQVGFAVVVALLTERLLLTPEE